uniref:PH domain-containing protein n=1 Tax=Ciona savignyi TaxID=51511 RepID=H2Y6I9_CIOSA
MKYQLLLKDILKFSERAGDECDELRGAVQVMHVVPKLANDMMMVARMSGFTGRISAQGKLLVHGTFQVCSSGSAEKERKVFFFEQCVIFSDLVDKKSEERGFVYKTSIKNSDLELFPLPSSETRFQLRNRGTHDVMELIATSQSVKSTWIAIVRQQLDNQLSFVNALADPITSQKQQLGNFNTNNNNNNNVAQPFLSTFRPNLNSKPGGVTSSTNMTSSSSNMTSEQLEGASTLITPPWSKQEKPENESMKLQSSGEDLHELSTSQQNMQKSLMRSNKTAQPRPASAADNHLVSPTTMRSNNHRSEPDLSTRNSFWLSPLSPANIRSSTCKFSYPGDNTSYDGVSISSGSTFTTVRSEPDKMPTVIALEDYHAVREDEISVAKGDALDIIATNAQGLCLVHRSGGRTTQAAEGWVPGAVLGHQGVHPTGLQGNTQKRSTPRMVKRNAKKTANSRQTLSRILRKSKSSEKLSTKSRSSDQLSSTVMSQKSR